MESHASKGAWLFRWVLNFRGERLRFEARFGKMKLETTFRVIGEPGLLERL